MRVRSFISLVCGVLLCVPVAFASPNAASAKREQVRAFLGQAIQYVQMQGKDAAIKEFNNAKGMFARGDLYVFAFGDDGKCLANLGNPEGVGKMAKHWRDAKGKYFIVNLQTAAKKGGGWVDYSYRNPTTGKIQPKTSYAESVVIDGKDQGWWIGAGYYHE